jgi:polyhydroxybutyrate depolymerase
VLVLHGFTQTAQGIMGYSGFNAIADEAGFLAVYPNGINTSWNVGLAGAGANDVGFISALIDTLAAAYAIDNERIYACGMSNGGFMSYRLACELSDRIAAIASVTGSMTTATFNACQPQRPVPVLEIHGTNDLIVPYSGSNGVLPIPTVLSWWVLHNNCDPTPVVNPLPDLVNEGSTVEQWRYGPGSAGSVVEHLRVVGGGHTWPGANFSGVGNTNRDINASSEIWRFFNGFRLSGSITNLEIPPHNAADLLLYPNPSLGEVRIRWPNAGEALLRIYRADGACVHQQQRPAGDDAPLELALPKGHYCVVVQSGGQLFRQLLVVM